LLGLKNSGVKFIAADNPQANNLTIGILALIAEHEREAISDRVGLARKEHRGLF
jgi:DNA invertase Pin-like site-specific DNA recombinase